MKNVTLLLLLLLNAATINLAGQNPKTEDKMPSTPAERIKTINSIMKDVSLVPRSTATADDKKLLKQYDLIRRLSLKENNGTAQSRSDLDQQLQLALQEANNIAKLRKTGKITLFPNDCYDQCDDQVGFGAAWNEFFCVFKCFKAAVVHFD